MAVKKLRPFEETIVEAIKTANSSHLELIAILLERTIITKDHALIVSTWLNQCMGFHFDAKYATRVANSIFTQGQSQALEKKDL
ncbi:MAG: hypothetical protein NTX72_00130 [Candidatus Uhrbacteria bacterium]|nr:hypothetical protein [Candidatus Uhrbacteria bacterium]